MTSIQTYPAQQSPRNPKMRRLPITKQEADGFSDDSPEILDENGRTTTVEALRIRYIKDLDVRNEVLWEQQ